MLICPYTPDRLDHRTKEWVEQHDGIFIDVGGSESQYYECLDQYWAGHEDLVVIEHDVLPGWGVYEGMLKCSHAWCTSPYLVSGTLTVTHSLGFVKFSKLLQECIPDIMLQVERVSFTNDPPRAWWSMDYKIAHILMKHRFGPHAHAMSDHYH